MNIREYIDRYFNIETQADEEGIYRYYIYEQEDDIHVSKTTSGKDSELVLECDDSNYFAIVYLLEQKIRFMIEGTKLSGAAILDNEYEDTEGNQIKEKGLVLYSDTWLKRYLRIDLYPYISVSMEINYEQYETNPDGTIIWE